MTSYPVPERARLRSVMMLLLVGGLLPSSGYAEETIRDPENPAMQEGDDAEESSEDAGDSGAETIRDPENPAMGEETDDENEDGGEAAADDGEDGGGESAFRAGYGTGLAVDLDWADNGEDIVEWVGEAHLELEQPLSENWKAVARGEFRHWIAGEKNANGPNYLFNAADPRGAVDARLGETYVLYRSDQWTIRAGHLVTSWGSTDIVRPGDVVNPLDVTDVSDVSTGSGARLPQPAVEVGFVEPNWSLTGIVVPFFRSNRVAFVGRDSAAGLSRNPAIASQFPVVDLVEQVVDESLYEDLQPLLMATSRPDEFPKNGSLGLRATGTRWNTDVGIGYLFGWDRTPFVTLDEDLRKLGRLMLEDGQVLQDVDLQGFINRNPEALELSQNLSDKQKAGEELFSATYDRMHTLLIDAARYVGPVGLRLDVSFQPERTFVTEEFGSVRRPTIFAAGGASYEKMIDGRPLAVTLEGFWMHPFDADSALSTTFVADGERGDEAAPILLFEDGYPGIAGAVDWSTPLWKLDVRVGSVVELETGGVILDARLGRRWTNWLKTSVGATIYEGPDPAERLSLGGLYDGNDRASLVVEGTF